MNGVLIETLGTLALNDGYALDANIIFGIPAKFFYHEIPHLCESRLMLEKIEVWMCPSKAREKTSTPRLIIRKKSWQIVLLQTAGRSNRKSANG